jgi:hypothetical protein
MAGNERRELGDYHVDRRRYWEWNSHILCWKQYESDRTQSCHSHRSANIFGEAEGTVTVCVELAKSAGTLKNRRPI